MTLSANRKTAYVAEDKNSLIEGISPNANDLLAPFAKTVPNLHDRICPAPERFYLPEQIFLLFLLYDFDQRRSGPVVYAYAEAGNEE